VDRHQRVPLVIGAREYELKLEIFEGVVDRGKLLLDFGARVGVLGFLSEFEQHVDLVDTSADFNPRCDLVAERGKLLEDALGRLGVVPEVRGRGLLFEAGYLLLFGSKVKDAPEGQRSGCEGR
jgi:hypothetical protein